MNNLNDKKLVFVEWTQETSYKSRIKELEDDIKTYTLLLKDHKKELKELNFSLLQLATKKMGA
jgi:hypothetical protein|tara:strand:- start:207 stop:395 length:189 start_codon:yes stop_codon:yes gene_type:complete